jgi:hypothetical protein
MDFIVGLPHTSARYDFVWVIVDGLTKVVHFIPVPKKIVSDRDPSSLLGFGRSCTCA